MGSGKERPIKVRRQVWRGLPVPRAFCYQKRLNQRRALLELYLFFSCHSRWYANTENHPSQWRCAVVPASFGLEKD